MPNLFLLFLIRRSSLLLIRPPKLLTPILPLFPLLSRGLLNLARNTNTHLSIMWLPPSKPVAQLYVGGRYLKLLQVGFRVINQGESSGFASTKLSAETECLDSLLGTFVEGCKTGADFIFGEIGFGRVEDVDDKLFAVEETVCDEFAGAESGTFVRLKVSIGTRRRKGGSSGAQTDEFFKIFDPRNSSMHPS